MLLGLAFLIDGGGWLAWPALWLLAARLDERSGWERVGDGSLAGVWAAGLAVGPWLFDALRTPGGLGTPSALLVAGGAIALHGGLFLAAFAFLWPRLPAPRWLAGAALWMLLELVRGSVGGVPWALLGHTQIDWPALAQVAELGGVPLVSFLVALPGLALADRPPARWRGLAVSALLIVTAAAFGTARLHAWVAPVEHGMWVRGVSGGHLSSDRDVAYLASTADGPRADLVVWPTHAVPGVLPDQLAALVPVAAAVRRHGPLLFGTGVRERGVAGPRWFDAAILLDASATMRGRYEKHLLVPFVERPVAGLEPGVTPPLTPGEGRGIPLRLGSLRLGPLLGWESVFAERARSWARAGADVLVAMADDELPEAGVRQLVRFSRFRTIETRRWMLRVSGTGRTLAVDPAGRRWPRSVIMVAPGVARPRTLVVRAPWLCPVAALALLGVLALLDAWGHGRGEAAARASGAPLR
jgi:apolipoprotein N-acyltransferase